MHEDIVACAEIVRKGDPDRFRAVMAAPVAARAKLFPIYAFNVEVARAPWVTQEPMIAEMRLQWWRDVLEEIRTGGPVRRHEVATPLAEVVSGDTAILLDQLVAARRWDIYKDPFENTEHLRDYLDQTSAGLLVAAVPALADTPKAPLRAAGYAMGLANWLRAVPALEQTGRIPLVDGTPAAVRELAEEGLNRLAKARAARSDIPKPARPALLALWQAGPILNAARKSPGRVADGALDVAPIRSRFALMARAMSGYW